MAALSPLQIAQIAYDAGFRGQALVTAVAVALAESSGRPEAVGDVALQNDKWGPSIGLWQVRSLREQQGTGGTRDPSILTDPVVNARSAFEISGGGENFTPWTVFKKGTYRKFLNEAQSAAGSVGEGTGIEYPTGPQGEVDMSGGGTVQAAGFSVAQVQGAQSMSDDQLREVIRRDFGYLSWALEIPEVSDVILRMARGELAGDRAFGALQQTDWWQNTEASARQWEALKNQDPAEANSRVEERLLDLRNRVSTLGLAVPEDRLRLIAEDSLRFSMSDAEMQQALIAEVDFIGEIPTTEGTFGASVDELMRIAEQEYMVPFSRTAATEWSRKILAGEADDASFRQFVKRAAVGRFPSFAEDIEQGITPAQIFDSYREMAARTLEMDSDQINLLDNPKFSRALEVVDDTGKRRPMSLSEWQIYLRSLPEWRTTSNARAVTADVQRSLGNMFGRSL